MLILTTEHLMNISLVLVSDCASDNDFPGVFYYFNSVLNPILYSLMSKRFRRGFSDIKRNLINK